MKFKLTPPYCDCNKHYSDLQLLKKHYQTFVYSLYFSDEKLLLFANQIVQLFLSLCIKAYARTK